MNVRVIARFRPVNSNEASREGSLVAQFVSPKCVRVYRQGIPKKDSPPDKEYNFDRIFASDESQETVFEDFRPAIFDVLQGFNATIFAYGQTGSGK